MSSLKELFLKELADVYDAEKQLTKALPKMAKNASSEELKEAFTEHLEQTKTHVERLEEVFEAFGEDAKGKTCQAMKGLIEEADEILKEEDASPMKDAAMIAAAQKVEHYEIASYGCLQTWAQILQNDQAADLLEETLNEEKEADEKLTEIAESTVNEEAAAGDTQEAEEEEEEEESSSSRKK